ncbi:MAG: YraN family protein [Pseudomonadota bacterium]
MITQARCDPDFTKPHTETPDRARRGAHSYFKGLSAEDSVARWYQARGGSILEHRWRGTAGEIDLIIVESGVVVFCEVKSSKCLTRAIEALSPRQVMRLRQTAAEYLGTLPAGELTEMRFDFAVVDGHGKPVIMQNGFGDV